MHWAVCLLLLLMYFGSQVYKILLASAFVSLCAGCSTSFKYTPTREQTYAPVVNRTGLAIRTGGDLRPDEEKQPGWCRNAEPIVAKALAEEVRLNKLFDRVKIHSKDVNPKKFSEIIQFRVKKFECASKPSFLESAGRTALEMQGIRGALIARSIPRKYTADVEVEFEVLDSSTRQRVFDKSYSASGVVALNGYQSDKPLVQQVSAELETVLDEFILDLTQIPSSRQEVNNRFPFKALAIHDEGASRNRPRSLRTLSIFRESSTVNPMRQNLLRRVAMNIRSRRGRFASKGNQVRKSPEPQILQLPPMADGCRASTLSISVSGTRLSLAKGKL